MSENEVTLKERALLQRIGELTTNYENSIADLRVALTNVSNERDRFKTALEEQTSGLEQSHAFEAPGVVGSEVVEGDR
jgi:chemotaxis regulatin CheY-phosphate phosphatase CheZ